MFCLMDFDDVFVCCFFFFFKQKTAYEMRISDWSSDVCSSDLWPMADNLQYTGTQYTNRKARMSVHSHEFNEGNPLAERRTRWAVVLTAVMMVVEIAGGWTYNSMALLADGWHMS